MKCEKCGKDYPTFDSFKDYGTKGKLICRSCTLTMTQEELNEYEAIASLGENQSSDRSTHCQEASEALTLAIFSIFCLGPILAPIAISKASKAEEIIAKNPDIKGEGKASAAKIIGIISLIMWGIGILSLLARN